MPPRTDEISGALGGSWSPFCSPALFSSGSADTIGRGIPGYATGLAWVALFAWLTPGLIGSTRAELTETAELSVDRLPDIVEFDPAEDLVVSLRAGNQLASDYFFALDRIETIFVPLGEMANALLFGLDVSSPDGAARGWIINEDTPFIIDMAAGTVQVGNRRTIIPEGSVERHADDIYADIAWLNEITPLTIEMDWPTLSLVVGAETSLPAERLLERRNRWAAWRPSRQQEQRIPTVTPYAMVSPPAIDVSASTSYQSEGDRPLSASVNLRAAADLGGHTATLFMQARDDRGLSDFRLAFSRGSRNADLLGPLRATFYEIGDITIPALRSATNQTFATGLTVTNRGGRRPRSFSDRTFTGTTTPGWAVELYRNGGLLAFTDETADGRYVFSDIDILTGLNNFTILELGPLGQIRQTSERYHIGGGMVSPGVLEYDFAVGHPSSLVSTGNRAAITDRTVDALVTVDAGLLTSLTLSGTVAASDRNGGEVFGALSGHMAIGPIYLDATMVSDQQGGRQYTMLTRLPLDTVSLGAELDIHDGLETPYFSGRPDQWAASASLSWRLATWAQLTFDYDYSRNAGGVDRDTLLLRWAGSARHASWSNRFRMQGLATGKQDVLPIDSNLSVTLRSLRMRPRLNLDYTITESGIDLGSASATMNWAFGDGYRGRLSASHDFRPGGGQTLALGASRAFGPVSIGATASANTSGAFQIGLTVSSGAAWDPWQGAYRPAPSGIASQGSAATRVVLDDGTGAVPRPLSGVRVRSGGRTAHTDSNGVAMLPPLSAGSVNNIDIIGGTLEDPFWLIEDDATAVMPRPGVVQPVTITIRPGAEAEGTISATRQSGRTIDLAGATVFAIDADGEIAARAVAAFDGFFILNDLLPGDYTLTPDPDQMISLGYAVPEPAPFTVLPTGGIVRLGNFHLMPIGFESDDSAVSED